MSDIYNIKTTNKYEDIIHLQHPTSANHPQMPIEDRAAQFSPFAALTGHEDAIRETQRRNGGTVPEDGTGKWRENR